MLYDGPMGYSTLISHEAGPERWAIAVKVNLSREETNELFLSGDSMLSWPAEGLVAVGDDESVLERSSIFVSEIAAHPSGLLISYSDEIHAQQAAALLRAQFAQAGIEEEV